MTTLTVKFANPAQEGKKFGSIVDTAGNRYPCPGNLVDKFQKGQTYEVALKTETWSGNSVQVIAGAPSNGSATPAQSAPRAASNSFGKNDVLVTAIALMKSFIEGGQFGLTDLPALETACLQAAKRLVGATQ